MDLRQRRQLFAIRPEYSNHENIAADTTFRISETDSSQSDASYYLQLSSDTESDSQYRPNISDATYTLCDNDSDCENVSNDSNEYLNLNYTYEKDEFNDTDTVDEYAEIMEQNISNYTLGSSVHNRTRPQRATQRRRVPLPRQNAFDEQHNASLPLNMSSRRSGSQDTRSSWTSSPIKRPADRWGYDSFGLYNNFIFL